MIIILYLFDSVKAFDAILRIFFQILKINNIIVMKNNIKVFMPFVES